jgi:putative transposase
MRDECLDIKDFATLLEARVIIGDWRHAYNHDRPHNSPPYQAPAVYASTRTHQPQLS